MLSLIACLYYVLDNEGKEQYQRILRIIISLIVAACWSISGYMMFFEYKRALGHIWYVHGVFWWYSGLLCFLDVILFYTIELDVTE